MSTKKVNLQQEPKKTAAPKNAQPAAKEPVKKQQAVKEPETNATVVKEHQENPTVVSEQPGKKTNNFINITKKELTTTDDSMKTRKFAWLAYILFFIPLLIDKTSPFVRHNVNEGLEINIVDVIGIILTICGAVIKTDAVAAQTLLVICLLVGIFLLVLTTITKVYMIAVSAQGKTANTPWMWNLRIIK